MSETHNEGKSGTYAWLAIGAFVVAWDLTQEESLTHAARRGLENPRSRLPVAGLIGITALHLFSALPEHLDPYYRLLDRDRKPRTAIQ